MDRAQETLKRMRARSTAGFAIALHVKFTTPRYLLQAYSKEWLDLYSSEGLVMNDPTVHWAFSNTGAIRWSDLAADDPAQVLAKAEQFGLRYGVAISLEEHGTRSMASFARSDREMTDIDIFALRMDMKDLHLQTQTIELFTPEMHERLKLMSIFLTHE